MTARTCISVRKDEASRYANSEDFTRIFADGLNGLFQLSFLLTGDQEKAEKCFVSGIEDCVKENRVFREWARSWAKRTVIRNAIRELRPRPRHPSSSPFSAVPSSNRQSGISVQHSPLDLVLMLKDFERFVFVMSVLEHYSQHDCALLLGCPISEVREARLHALEGLGGARHPVSLVPVSSQVQSGHMGM
jgi:DNA-directed RNA polymerase specialized sigma24 family protein